MRKNPPKIELSWRDENYGSVYAVAAFRDYAGSSDWSDRTHQRFRGRVKRADLLAARGKPIGSVTRRGILSGHWDQGTVVSAFRGERGSFRTISPENRAPLLRERGSGAT